MGNSTILDDYKKVWINWKADSGVVWRTVVHGDKWKNWRRKT
jgi:hypothetical protein